MTWRAVLAGILAGAFVCAFCYFNDGVMHQTMFIGSIMPISVYGGLILFVLLVNPLLKRWAFSAGELTVALALTLVMCGIPGAGLMRSGTAALMMPHYWERSSPAPGMPHITSVSVSATVSSPAENARRPRSGLISRTKRIRPPYTESGMMLPTNIVWCMTASLK